MHYIKKFWVFLFIGILLFPISAFINKAFAHPHNFLWIEATSKKITIHSLHKQKVSLEYLKKNFILENCQYSNFSQDMTHYEKLGETLIFIPISNCPALIIQKNTLFEDFWKEIPIIIQTRGFKQDIKTTGVQVSSPNLSEFRNDISKNPQVQNEKTPSNENDLEPFSLFANLNIFAYEDLSSNLLISIMVLILLGAFFAFTSDLLTLVIPISLASKHEEDKWLWLKAGIIHMIVTYVAVVFSLRFLAAILFRYSGILVIVVGILMIFETVLKKKIPAPLLIACIPDTVVIFFSIVIFKDNQLLAYLSPLLMNLGEILALRLGSLIPIPHKVVKFTPYFIIILGIIFTIKVALNIQFIFLPNIL